MFVIVFKSEMNPVMNTFLKVKVPIRRELSQ
jgi:hypothetical protein